MIVVIEEIIGEKVQREMKIIKEDQAFKMISLLVYFQFLFPLNFIIIFHLYSVLFSIN